jgi:hypothetical protein
VGLSRDEAGVHRVGQGILIRIAQSPAALTYQANGADQIRSVVRQAATAVHMPWRESNALVLRRGPYVIAAGLEESVPGAKAAVLSGDFINLFDAELPVLHSFTLQPGARALLLDLKEIDTRTPEVLAAACRIREERQLNHALQFQAEGIGDTNAVVRVSTRREPSEILVGGKALPHSDCDFADNTVRLRFPNSVDPLAIEVRFRDNE